MATRNPLLRSGGWIVVFCGPMCAGKTESLLAHANRMRYAKAKILVVRPQQDTRAALGPLRSRDGRAHKSVTVSSSAAIKALYDQQARKPKAVYVDEAQFFDAGIIAVADELASKGCVVVCAGLDTDFRGEPFGPMAGLLAIAEKVVKLHAVCTVCGAQANRSQRLVNGRPADYGDAQIRVGDTETYEPRCRAHHVVSRA